MVPEKGSRKEELDERLIEVRDAILIKGEKVVAQEAGDQGQGIILTDSRIFMIKVGLTATGELNGRRTGIFHLSKIQNIVLRKGPMGGVIQVMGEASTLDDDGYPPVTLTVFSYPDRVKRCDAIAPAIEKALGRPLERIEPKIESDSEPAIPADTKTEAPVTEEAPEPKKTRRAPKKAAAKVQAEETVVEAVHEEPEQVTPVEETPIEETPVEQKPRGGRVAKSLAEEMYEETLVAEDKPALVEQEVLPTQESPAAVESPVEEPETAAINEPIASSEPAPVEIEQEDDDGPEPAPAIDGLRPNPKLRQPVRSNSKSGSKVFVLFSGLLLILLLGVAVTAPLRQQSGDSKIELNVTELANNPSVLKRHYLSIQEYQKELMPIISLSDQAATALRAAIASRNSQTIAGLIKQYEFDKAYNKLAAIKSPLGLAKSHDLVESALFIRKTVAEGSATESLTPEDSLKKLSEADAKLAKGLEIMDDMLSNIRSRMPKTIPGQAPTN